MAHLHHILLFHIKTLDIIPDNLPMELASIQDPLGNAIHTLTGGPVENSTVAIHGLGPIGLFAVNAAKAMGARKVIAIDWDNETRMRMAADLGADIVLGKDDDIVARILIETTERVWIIVVNSQAAPAALNNAIQSTRMGGYVNVLSVYGNSMTKVSMNDIVFRYLHLKGINGRVRCGQHGIRCMNCFLKIRLTLILW